LSEHINKADLQAALVANRALLGTLSLIAQTVAGCEDQLARTIYRLATDAGAAPVGIRCLPGCAKWHTLEEAMEIMRVRSKSTIYEYEAQGLRRNACGDPKYNHVEIDRFMWEGNPTEP
jgi:hypothetical protein